MALLQNHSISFGLFSPEQRKISSVEQHFCHIYCCVQMSHHVPAVRGEEWRMGPLHSISFIYLFIYVIFIYLFLSRVICLLISGSDNWLWDGRAHHQYGSVYMLTSSQLTAKHSSLSSQRYFSRLVSYLKSDH